MQLPHRHTQARELTWTSKTENRAAPTMATTRMGNREKCKSSTLHGIQAHSRKNTKSTSCSIIPQMVSFIQVSQFCQLSIFNTIFAGIETSTDTKVVIKQVPKAKITSYINVDGRPVPKEFHLHRLASSISGVVKAFEWFERRTT